MYAELITIGDEILIGQIVDSNSAWIASELNEVGIEVKQITSVADKIEDIKAALTLASSRAEVIFMTGGLGPTNDDLTRQALSEYFNSKLIINEDVLAFIKTMFSERNRPLLDANVKQAQVLECAEVLHNKAGTAPGMYILDKGKHLFVMPGVPSEMRYLVSEEIIPRLKCFPSRDVLIHKTILTAGIGESNLALQLATIENSLPDYIQMAYLPSFEQVRLRLTAKGKNKQKLIEKVNAYVELIKKEIPGNWFSDDNRTLEESLIDFMQKQNLTLGTAESCTGGKIAHLLTLIPGSSQVFKGGVIAYTNIVKTNLLGVTVDTLKEYTAVSEQTVKAMAEGARKLLNTDYAIATTGIAGPTGETAENPVGTVWIGIAGKGETITQRFVFDSIRGRTIERSSKKALILLFELLYKESKE